MVEYKTSLHLYDNIIISIISLWCVVCHRPPPPYLITTKVLLIRGLVLSTMLLTRRPIMVYDFALSLSPKNKFHYTFIIEGSSTGTLPLIVFFFCACAGCMPWRTTGRTRKSWQVAGKYLAVWNCPRSSVTPLVPPKMATSLLVLNGCNAGLGATSCSRILNLRLLALFWVPCWQVEPCQ